MAFRALIICVFKCSTIVVGAQGQITSTYRYHPKDIIQSQRVDTAKIFVETVEGLTLEEEIAYDVQGNEATYINHGSKYYEQFKYDSNDRKIARYFIPFGESFYERDTFIYNSDGTISKEITFQNNGAENNRNEYNYEHGSLRSESYFYKGKLRTLSLNYYDKKGRVVHISRVFQGSPAGEWERNFDKKDNCIEFVMLKANGELEAKQVLKYDELNRLIEVAVFGSSGKLEQLYKTKYNDNGLIIYTESYTGIQNGDVGKADYEKRVYKYTHR